MVRFCCWSIIFIATIISLPAQYLRVEKNHFLNYYHLSAHSYLLKENRYDYGTDFQEGLAVVVKANKYGAIDTLGREIIPLKYAALSSFSQGQAIFTSQHQKGIITTKGKELIPAQYDYIGELISDRRVVASDGKWGIIDTKGQKIIPCSYDYIGELKEGRASVSLKEKWGFLDRNGNIVIKPTYDKVANMYEGIAAVVLNGQYGYIDSTGKEIIPIQYDLAWDFSEGLAAVKLDETIGFINKSAKIIIAAEYEDFFNCSEKVVAVKEALSHKWGFISMNGKALTHFIYEEAKPMKSNRAAVKKEGKWGYIDETGAEIIPCQYSEAFDFDQDYAIVGVGEPYIKKKLTENPSSSDFPKIFHLGYINKKGEMIIPADYTYIRPISSSYVWASGNTGNSKYIFLKDKSEIKSGDLYVDEDAIHKNFIEPQIPSFSVLKDKNGKLIKDLRFKVKEIYPKDGFFSTEDHQLYNTQGFLVINKSIQPPSQAPLSQSESVQNGLSIVSYHGKYGVVNMKGEYVIEPQYAQITQLTGDVFLCKSFSLSGFYTRNNQAILPIQYPTEQNIIKYYYYALSQAGERIIYDRSGRAVKEAKENFVAINNKYFALGNDKLALYDNKGNEVIPPIYQKIIPVETSDDLFIVENESSMKGLINSENEILVPFMYQEIKAIAQDLFIVSGDSLSAVVNRKNETIIPPIYRSIEPIEEMKDLYIVQLHGKKGVIQSDNKTLIPIRYYNIYKPFGSFKNYLIAQDASLHQEIYTFSGKKLSLPPFTEIYLASTEDMVLVRNEAESGLYDMEGSEIYPMSEDEILIANLNNTYIPIKKDDKWGIIDRKGHIAALFEYDYLKTVQCKNEVLVIFEQADKTGIMDTDLEVLFEDTKEITYDETLAAFQIENRYVDKYGKVVSK